jgi:hypothetical protein
LNKNQELFEKLKLFAYIVKLNLKELQTKLQKNMKIGGNHIMEKN